MWRLREWSRRLRRRRNIFLPPAGYQIFHTARDFISDLPGRIGDSQDVSRWFGLTEWGFIANVLIFLALVALGWWPVAWLPAPLRRRFSPETVVADEQEDAPPKATESEIEAFRELHRQSKRAKHWPQPQITSIRDCQEEVRCYLSRPRDLNRDTSGFFQLTFRQKMWLGIKRLLALEPSEDVRPKHKEFLQFMLNILAERLNSLLVWTPSTTEGFSAKEWQGYLEEVAVLSSQGALDEARRRFRLDAKDYREVANSAGGWRWLSTRLSIRRP